MGFCSDFPVSAGPKAYGFSKHSAFSAGWRVACNIASHVSIIVRISWENAGSSLELLENSEY